MKLVNFLYFFLLLSPAFAQNLVPNPSFEDYSSCPTDGRVWHATGWTECGGTPDYSNSCSGLWNVPNGIFGYQKAATGIGYCDFGVWALNELEREILGCQLIEPLIVGHIYIASFKCKPSTMGGYSVQINGIGMKFSTVAYDSLNHPPIDNISQVYSKQIVSDTLNWTTVSGSFVADSAYSFLSLTNFMDDSHTNTQSIDNWDSGFSVYFLDDVSVMDITIGIEEIKTEDRIKNITYFNMLGQEVDIKSAHDGIYIKIIQTKNSIKSIKFTKTCHYEN